MTLEAGTPIGKYVVKSKLAEGGMAEIYLATARGPEGFEKEVVIKRVRSFLSDDEGFVRMFIQEARLASRLNHANVVQIFDFDKHEDSYYLAMEYVRGTSLWNLRKRCREKGIRIPPVLVAYIGSQVAAGLHYAHRTRSPEGETLGLVHRDVTPHNVLLSFDGAVKLTDFGIAKAGNKLTQPGVLKGKFAYMAPEQARGEEVDARTDVFALGVVLWEMLTGGRLFDGESDVAVLRAVQESVIVPPARLNPDVPELLNEVVCTALEREPAARYQSAGELERALAQCVLRGATSVDDTDLGTFVRRLFDVPLTQFMLSPAVLQDRSQRHRSGSTAVAPGVPAPERAEPPSASRGGPEPQVGSAPAAPREATAVMPGSTPSSGSQRLAPGDEPEASLVSAPTLVLTRDVPGGQEAKASAASPRAPTTPAAPLPAVRQSRSLPPVGVTSPEASAVKAPEPAVAAQASEVARPLPGSSRGRLAGGVGLGVLVLLGGGLMWRASTAPSPEGAPAPVPAPTAAPDNKEVAGSSPRAGAEAPPVPPPAQEAVVAAAPATGAPSTPATAPVPSVPIQPSEAAPQATPAVKAKGTLVVQAIPYADVYLDGKLVRREVQGTWSTSLVPGTYQLKFVHPNHSDSSKVTITANGRTMKSFRLPGR
ncbi:Serine/threonine kinase PKN11 [Cystobacter fuscus DSM 2262]|uniref:Serine/threonine kinase PKN11 n=1 Tax=Cystobacter fuscus (strain ATCC 25194 / DSM 2262 / NBRC 100088 / M29) TaxID=1242864 RepID=S9PL87_CYSF2|nr:serine/threonine-protein kinase [Cystobacter fuscus]EPX63232.1 Serine/threonine kinase PKN11 [Cystobacter fuscus DSM 2262]